MLTELSFFMPAYNEKDNITDAINNAKKICRQIAKRYEIIIVGGISTDGTDEIVKHLSKINKEIRYVPRGKNKDYGSALIKGFTASRYKWIFYTDSDNQFDLNDLKRFIKYANNYDLIIGYRVRRKDRYIRILIGKIFSLIVSIIIRKRIRDVDCAFKLIRSNVVKSIKLKTRRSVDPEIIIKAHKRGFKIKQLPVRHLPRIHGSSEIERFGGMIDIKILIISIIELLKILLDRE